MLTCKDASQLMSQSLDRRLKLADRIGLRMHLVICKGCKVAYRQMNFIHQLCRRITAKPDNIVSMQPGLTNEAKERILKELHRKRGGQSTPGR